MTDILQRSFFASPDAVESAVGNETVILHLENGTYYGLDEVGTRIWALVKEGVASPDICLTLSDEFRVELATIEADARHFFGELQKQGLLIEK